MYDCDVYSDILCDCDVCQDDEDELYTTTIYCTVSLPLKALITHVNIIQVENGIGNAAVRVCLCACVSVRTLTTATSSGYAL